MLTTPQTIDTANPGAATIAISIRSTVPITAELETIIRTRLARHLRHEGVLVERATVRFTDVNGPKGGVDTMCRIKVVLAGRPSILTEKLDTSPGAAFARALAAVSTAVRRVREKHATRTL